MPQLTDTHPEAAEVQLDLLRRASVARRLELTRSISGTVMALSRRALARAHPELDAAEVDLWFVECHYGRELADRVRAYRAKR